MKSYRWSNTSAYFGLICLTLLSSPATLASEHKLIEHPNNNGLLTDTWVITYSADDFSDKIDQASLVFIPKDYQHEKVFFMRCKEYFANFSVQYLDHENHLKDSDGHLPNASAKFAKHGYVYDDKQALKVTTANRSENYDISVGGQNNHLTQLFKTDIIKQPGLLGMSFHYSFSYKEMPSFRNAKNNSDTQSFFEQLTSALKTNAPIDFELESEQGHKQIFSLDTPRLNKFAPKEVMEFCFTGRTLN